MVPLARPQPPTLRFTQPNRSQRQRIAELRELAEKFRRIAEEYSSVDRHFAETLRDTLREIEAEVDALERGQPRRR